MDEQNEIGKPETAESESTEQLLSKLVTETGKGKKLPEQKPEILADVLKSRH